MPNWGTGKWPKQKRACLTHQQSRTVMPSPPSWCSRAANTPQWKRSCPQPLSRLPTSRISFFFFVDSFGSHTLPVPRNATRRWTDWHPDWSLWPQVGTDPVPGSIICDPLASAFLRTVSHTEAGLDVSIRPPDVGGMHQNSAAHLVSTSSSSSTLVPVSARRDHRARAACGEKRKQLRRQASALDFILSFFLFFAA